MTECTTEPVRFDTILPTNPNLEALAEQAAQLCATLDGANSIADVEAPLARWNSAQEAVDSYSSLVELRFNQDTRNAESKVAHEDWEQRRPRYTELLVDVKRKLLAHPLRSELEASLGSQAFALWESDVLAFDAAIKDDLFAESKLESEYTELMASAELEFCGESYNLSTILKHRQSDDRGTRYEASSVYWSWFGAHGERLDSLYDELVKLRAGMAQRLGFGDFVELGYKRMKRVDYDRADVERFRKEVTTEVVPLCSELRRLQAEKLGVEQLMEWDEAIHDPRGNPKPGGDRAWLVGQAQSAYSNVNGELGDFFRCMQSGGFLDLDSRAGKGGGAFCTSFPAHGMPYVYANFNGTMGDVRTLTHEIGHAFQSYKSRRLSPVDYQWPTAESAEVHSMSLEFLSYPQMERFFGEEAERFRRAHLTQSLYFLPYGTAVDHFQHLVYERPDATAAERHEMWREMERTYLPWRQWGDLDYPAKGGRWQAQLHIYVAPFYYIDYVLAQTCALQFWSWADKDREAALRSYVELCGRGGSAPFQELVRGAGLTSPFDEGCLSGVVQTARESLGLE